MPTITIIKPAVIYDDFPSIWEISARYHDERAKWHEAEGHPPEWAEGSRRKAAKWRAREAEWEAGRPKLDPVLQAMMDRLADGIARSIMEG